MDISDHDLLLRIDERVRIIKSDLDELRAAIDTQAERIGELERWKAYTIGAATVVAFIVSILFNVI
ncbi:MAG: hypothetical protein ACXQS4_04590 [Methermicoccaceae archaeon]